MMSKNTTIAVALVVAGALNLTTAPAFADPDTRDTEPRVCVHNYFAPRPCLSTVSTWRQFAGQQGLAYDRVSAEIFQAYAEWNFDYGDRLLAKAKGVDAAQVKGIGRQVASAIHGNWY